MTISTIINTKEYTGDGSTTSFSFPYLFFSENHINVYVNGVITNYYSVSGVGNESGGSIIFNTAPASLAEIIIQRVVPYNQETDFENFDGNPADVTEKQFDLIVMQTQQLAELVDRAIKVPVGATAPDAIQLLETATDAAEEAATGAAAAQTAAELAQTAAETAQSGAETAEANAAALAAAASVGNLNVLTEAVAVSGDYLAFADQSDSGAGKKDTILDIVGSTLLDEDDMFSNSALQAPTQQSVKAYVDTYVNAIGSIGGGIQDIDLDLGRSISATVDTSTTTFTFSNPKATGNEDIFTIHLTNGGSQTVNWPASVDWVGGLAPTLTASGVDELAFKTIDGGTTWVGLVALDVK